MHSTWGGVWLLERDDDNRTMMLQALMLSGFIARGFVSPEHLLFHAKRWPAPCLVVTDAATAGGHEMALRQHISSQWLVVTTWPSSQMRTWLSLGISAHLQKPFALEALFDRVTALGVRPSSGLRKAADIAYRRFGYAS